MPIKPMSVQYDPIPDVEDVTPVDGSIETKAKRSFKFFAIIFACCLIAGVVFIFGMKIKKSLDTSVAIYQTCAEIDDTITSLSVSDMHARGFHLGTLEFGNAQCSTTEQIQKICTPPKFRTSKIVVDSTTSYQKILGFGGAFTESAAYNYFKLPEAVQEKFIELYFGSSGIGYSLGRVHINSCDFSLQSYSFDNIPGDYDLQYFDTEVTHDNAQMLPLIRLAMSAAKLQHRPINLLASPWSPPSWLKEPVDGKQTMTGSATPNGLIDTPVAKLAWAQYISKFITAYTNHGVPMWAVTPQNEPEFPAPWEACAYNASYEKNFINGYLGPVLEQDHPEVLILAFDHNKDHLEAWTAAMLGHDPSDSVPAGRYIDGMAFHWYAGTGDRLMDGTYGYDAIAAAHEIAPHKVLLATEGCSCPGVELGSVLRAERLGHDVMFDMLNWAQGWIDWNLLVDSEGGPNHLGNNCDAPIITTPDFSDIVIQPKYHYFGHFSKFVEPGSVRIESSVVGSYGFAITDPNVRAGMELGVFPCEQSVRQQWKRGANSTVQLTQLAKDSEAKDGYMAPLCIGPGDDNRPYLKILICTGKPTPFALTLSESGQLQVKDTGLCVTMVGDKLKPGNLLNLAPCLSAGSDSQSFVWEQTTGEIFPRQTFKSYEDGGTMCLTAGWPFLTAAAFRDTKQSTVVVAMNEAALDTQIILTDKVKGDLWFGINGHAIQTLVY